MKSWFGLLCLLFSLSLFAQNKAIELHVQTANTKMGEGKFDEAAKAWERALVYEPDNIDFLFGYGMALYRQEKYPELLEKLEPVIEKGLASIPYYRIVGNTYDIIGQYEKGKQVLNAGIEKYPNEGELQLDLGIIEMIREDHQKALEFWEQGIESDPIFSDNYYWCTKTYAKSNEPIWALYYGELFLNLNRNGGDKFDEISRIVYRVYGDMIEKKSSASPKIVLTREGTNYLKEAHEQIFSILDKNGLLRMDRGANAEGKINRLRAISYIRKDFLDLWNQVYAEKYPINIYKRHNELVEKNYFDSYNFWVMGAGNQEEFWKFHDTKKIIYSDYLSWFLNNPMRINIMDFFVKDTYYSTSPQASGAAPPPTTPPATIPEPVSASPEESTNDSPDIEREPRSTKPKKKKEKKNTKEKIKKEKPDKRDSKDKKKDKTKEIATKESPTQASESKRDSAAEEPEGEMAEQVKAETPEITDMPPLGFAERTEGASALEVDTNSSEEAEPSVAEDLEASASANKMIKPYQAFEVDSLPEYVGGDYALREYIHKQVKVPEKCYHKTDQIVLYVSLVLNAEGQVQDASIKKGEACGMENQLLRVLHEMPAWIPGYRKGQSVPVLLTLPVKFRLE